MRRLLRLLHLVAEADRAVVHPRHQEIERAALRMLVKAGMDGHARLWPNPLMAHRKPALLIQVDKASRRFSQVALGLLGDYCITYVAQHFELELDRVFWSIHPEADLAEALSACGPTTLGYLVEETHGLLESEAMTLERLAQLSDDIQHEIQGQLDADVLAQKTRAAIQNRRNERGLRG